MELITWECRTFLEAVILGGIFALEYDSIRVIRRVFPHRHLWILWMEDIIYWVYVSIVCFVSCLHSNNGIMRFFILSGLVLGGILWCRMLGKYYIKYAAKFMKFILIPLKKLKLAITMLLGYWKQKWRAYEIRNKKRKGTT